MAARRKRAKPERETNFEGLEPRQVMSAQPVGDFFLEYRNEDGAQISAVADSFSADNLDQLLNDAHDQTGLSATRDRYGFTGGGQTVAVIDSGIAYDHYALGGGLGANYRVVGGWDFTDENDADPYDDGFAGSHGTHVAGIIGSTDATHMGVAPDVDLVALRVFNDFGGGYFEWVEDALQWVHDHRNDFENPITAVNLSVGASWNADTVPNWAILEEEFAQLERDGIFISVAAGNSFGSYGEPGLAYPAASPHVVPVSSVDDDGGMSYFSQRHDRVLAAPGSGIISTIPDYKGNNNGIADDFASYSGTSMAAPYVTGSSVLVREAMEFVGYQNITQDTIYDHLRSTADQVYDAATSAYYHVINMEAAIEGLMPDDDFGSSAASAHSLGTLTGNSSLSGLIGTTDDADYFSFTAAQTGELQFSFDTTHDLSLNVQVGSGSGSLQAGTLTLDVVAGQTYIISLNTTAGIGFYSADVHLASSSGGDSGSGNSGSDGSENDSGSDTGSDTGTDTGNNSGGNDSGSDSNSGKDGNNIAQIAYDLDQSKQLEYVGSDYLNWGGKNEKWVQGNDGWYFILSDGEVYQWSGRGGANGTLVATLDGSFYNDLSKLYDAQPSGDSGGSDSGNSDSGNSDSGNSDSGNSDSGDSGSGDSGSGDSGSGDGGSNDNGSGDNGSGNSGTGDGGSDSGSDSDEFARARELDDRYGFFSNGSYHENWAGMGEKWIQSESLGWVFITTDGSVYDWNGSVANAAASTLIANLDPVFHTDPTLLTDPPADSGSGDRGGQDEGGEDSGSDADEDTGGDTGGDSGQDSGNTAGSVQRRAYDLDQQFGLKYGGDYYTNWASHGEKWIASDSGQWYFITGSGDFYRWNGSQASAMDSELVDTFDASYHADPAKLHDAPQPTSSSSVDTSTNRSHGSVTGVQSHGQLHTQVVSTETVVANDETTVRANHRSQAARLQHSIQFTFTGTVSSDDHAEVDDLLIDYDRLHDIDGEIEAIDAIFDALDELGDLTAF